MKKWISMALSLLLLVNLAQPVLAEPEPAPLPGETPAAQQEQSAPAAPESEPEQEPQSSPAPEQTPAPQEGETEQAAVNQYLENAVLTAETDADGFTRGTEEGSDYWWKVDDNGTLTIKGTRMADFWNQEFSYSTGQPWPIEYGKITQIIIQDGVQYIGSGAFWDLTTVQSVSLPSSLITIADHAIACRDLGDIVIPEGVVSIGDYALNGGGCRSIHVPASVKEIGIHAFGTNIAWKSLTEITVDPQNPNFCSIDGALYTKDGTILLQVPDARKGEFVVSDGVATIKRGAFFECQNLAGIVIPASVKTIENAAFGYTSDPQYIQFLGSAPEMVERPETGQFHDGSSGTFTLAKATVYYPQDDPSWTEAIKKDYGGTLTWVAYDPAEPLPFKKEVTPLPNSGFNVEDGLLFGVPPKVSAALLQTKIENGAQIVVKDANGNVLASTASVGTGCTIGFGSDGATGQVQVVVRGDVNGNASVEASDVLLVRRQILKIRMLEGAYLQAALITGNTNEPGVQDVLKMRRYILNIVDTLN